jgi:hypothetical protein
MRLFKLLFMVAVGWCVYEFLYGAEIDRPRQQARGGGGGQRGRGRGNGIRQRNLKRALNEDPGRMNVTGPGEGKTESTSDAGGGSAKRVVGRGVVQK